MPIRVTAQNQDRTVDVINVVDGAQLFLSHSNARLELVRQQRQEQMVQWTNLVTDSIVDGVHHGGVDRLDNQSIN